MGKAVYEEDAPFLSHPGAAGAVICRTEHGTLHAGVLHKARGAVSVLHLGWEDRLRSGWNWRKLWATPEVELERLRSVAGLCRLIWSEFERTRLFPYALKFENTKFSSEGRLILGEGERGLTCATFILAVFKSVGIQLVDESQWPVRAEENEAFLESITAFATPAHLQALKREVAQGVQRIPPQEVVAACEYSPPASFESCVGTGIEIAARL